MTLVSRPIELAPEELKALRAEWVSVQEQIDQALNAHDLSRAVSLSQRCRQLDRVIFSQPLSFIEGVL